MFSTQLSSSLSHVEYLSLYQVREREDQKNEEEHLEIQRDEEGGEERERERIRIV
jgi:hypothetical protein